MCPLSLRDREAQSTPHRRHLQCCVCWCVRTSLFIVQTGYAVFPGKDTARKQNTSYGNTLSRERQRARGKSKPWSHVSTSYSRSIKQGPQPGRVGGGGNNGSAVKAPYRRLDTGVTLRMAEPRETITICFPFRVFSPRLNSPNRLQGQIKRGEGRGRVGERCR